MESGESASRHSQLVQAFNDHEHRRDGARVAGSLADGLTLLRRLFYTRVHDDVEIEIGRDSMLIPISEQKTEISAKREIELYQIAESADTAGRHAYVGTASLAAGGTGDDWFLDWLVRFRLPEAAAEAGLAERIEAYRSAGRDQRRLAFTDVLANVLHESRKVPLVLFRLLPLSVEIATSLAFGDAQAASDARDRQLTTLPAIRDCSRCRGEVLDNGEQCPQCGNPLWKFDWLTAD